jgi:PDZ domain-containing protein/aspartyl protease
VSILSAIGRRLSGVSLALVCSSAVLIAGSPDVARGAQASRAATSGSSATVVLPIVDLVDGAPVVEVRIGAGPPLRFEFDSGSAELIDSGAAERAHLKLNASTRLIEMNAANPAVAVATDVTVRLGALDVSGLPFVVMPAPWRQSSSVDGVLGRGLLKQFAVTMDLTHRRLVLTDPIHYRPPADGVVLPLVDHGGLFAVQASVDGALGWFALDSGMNGDVALFPGFQRRSDLAARYRTGRQAEVGTGPSGHTSPLDKVAGQSLALGPRLIAEPTIILLSAGPPAPAYETLAGLIGMPMLARFEVTFDVARGCVVLAPATAGLRSHSGPGLETARENDKTSIVRVIPGGPGWRAGLRDGDEILAIDSFPIGRLPPGIWERLWSGPAGTQVRVRVKHGDRIAERTLKFMAWRSL